MALLSRFHQHLPQPGRIPLDPGGQPGVGREGELDALVVGDDLEDAADLPEEAHQLEGDALDVDLARFQLGEVEDVVQHAQQRASGRQGGVDQILLLAVQLGLVEDLVHPEHPVHRGADLVAHHGQEARAHLQGGAGLDLRGAAALDLSLKRRDGLLGARFRGLGLVQKSERDGAHGQEAAQDAHGRLLKVVGLWQRVRHHAEHVPHPGRCHRRAADPAPHEPRPQTGEQRAEHRDHKHPPERGGVEPAGVHQRDRRRDRDRQGAQVAGQSQVVAAAKPEQRAHCQGDRDRHRDRGRVEPQEAVDRDVGRAQDADRCQRHVVESIPPQLPGGSRRRIQPGVVQVCEEGTHGPLPDRHRLPDHDR